MERDMLKVRSIVVAMTVLLGTASAWAAEGDGRRASVPPGTSVDGAGPVDGALVGGSIQRSEKRATPVEVERCRDLEGTLKAQCLRDAKAREPSPAAESEASSRRF
jgi:hypothetical protein